MDKQPTQAPDVASEERRAFLARAGKIAVVAPAASLLLAASNRQALANYAR